jgi:hypothetical protein
MEELKIITLTIDDIFDVYAACMDKDKYVMNHIQKYYINKCYQGSLITKINKVIKTSHCEVNGGYADGRCFMYAEVEVTGITYKPGDILVGLKFIKLYGIFQCVLDNMVISLENIRNVIMPNEIITNVCLKDIDYNQLDKMCATSTIHTCRTIDLRYNIGIPKKMSKHEIEQLDDIRDKIKLEIVRRNQADKEMLSILELYHYSSTTLPDERTVSGWNGKSVSKQGLIDIIDLKLESVKPGVYKRSADIALSCPEIYLESSSASSIEAITPYVALFDMFYDIYNNMRAINDMASIYTKDLIASNKIVWKYITDARLNTKSK